MNQLFHSAALKLTLWYLGIIMALSIGFSVAIFSLSRGDLEHNIDRQLGVYYRVLSPGDFDSFASLRQRQLDQDLSHLKGNLVSFNLIVLALGGGLSYFLARRTLKPIEEALDAQKRFTGDASHELRTPLAVMQSENEIALRDPKLTKAEAVALIGSNLEEVDKLKRLSDGLLALATEDAKTPQFHDVDLGLLVDEVVERLQKVAKAKKVELEATKNKAVVRGDKESLSELLNIILDNAIKYSPSGSKIKLATSKRGKEALITISDQGPGIDAKDLPRIFERFYRADTSRTKSQAGGYGLGLAIAKKIVEMHGGFIDVKSAPHKGATFTIHLPAS